MNPLTLKKLQNTEFEILCSLDDFCVKHGIEYSLYAGTALGAVRHGGFIPWDDDIDISMTRTEFDRFCTIFRKEPIEGCYLESILTDEYCGTCHAKLRKNGTILLSQGEIEEKGHHGIWVDIFPLDKIPNNNNIKSQKLRYGKELVLLTRANVNMKNDTFQKRVVRRIVSIIPHSLRKKRILYIHKWLVNHMNDGIKEGYIWKSLSTIQAINEVSFSPNNVEGFTKISFNEKLFPIYKNYNGFLTESFGDYMKLPPEKERVCTHSPKKVKF